MMLEHNGDVGRPERNDDDPTEHGVNCNTKIAAGHRRPPFLEESGDAGKKALVRPVDGLDDEAEGRRRIVP
jgi:hypothetical protein